MENAKNVPIAAKIIAILYYIVGVYLILGGILTLISGSMIGFGISIFSLLGSVGGIIMIALGILFFYGGRGLYQGKNWARIFAIVIASLAIITSLLGIIVGSDIGDNVYSLIFNIAIGSYLLLNGKIKEAFKN